MDLAHFGILINTLLNKNLDMVPEKSTLVILYSKSDMWMSKNGKDTKHTRHIARIMNFVRYGEKCKIQNIDCCEGDLQVADIATKNVGKDNLPPRMKYIMVRHEN